MFQQKGGGKPNHHQTVTGNIGSATLYKVRVPLAIPLFDIDKEAKSLPVSLIAIINEGLHEFNTPRGFILPTANREEFAKKPTLYALCLSIGRGR